MLFDLAVDPPELALDFSKTAVQYVNRFTRK
jgi:hypothetical protein